MKSNSLHIPVLCNEMIQALGPMPGGVYLDGTFGAGGYTRAILEATNLRARVIALDVDGTALEKGRQYVSAYGEQVMLVHSGFHEVRKVLGDLGVQSLNGAVLDLGLSSDQLESAERGFSFQRLGPLDMRFDMSSGKPAMEYLREFSVQQLEEILATYGEERYCKKLARAIFDAASHGSLATTMDLARCVENSLRGRRGRIHPATRVFQAVRIMVNKEIDRLRTALLEIPQFLSCGARFCVVSYHSLEDREVKIAFRELARDERKWKLVTKKPIRPTFEEIARNPRSRSARLRAIELVDAGDNKETEKP